MKKKIKGFGIMIKVLHIGEYVQGGVATYIKTLITRDLEFGIDNYLLMAEEKSEHVWNFPKNKITYYPYHRSLYSLIPAMCAIQEHVKYIKPDIIFLHSSWAGMLTRIPLLFGKKKFRIIYNPHGWSFLMNVSIWCKRLYALIERTLAWKTDLIINVSRYEYNCGIQYGMPQRKMKVIYTGIPDVMLPVSQNIRFDADRINILFVGRFDQQKGLDVLLKIFRKNFFSHLHLYVIGAPVISASTDDYHDDENITFLGWIKNDQIGEYYLAADAIIMPSRWEGFSIVALEAMRYGKAVLASDCTSLPEQVQNGVNGYLFSLNDEHQLSAILQNLSSEELAAMGERARKIYCEKFVADRMLDEFSVLYRYLSD
ncbi:hypothetical protein HMPREF9334_01859 [Selenomonas infelix ATCC 43532]|uniref:Glycosyltransferase subfamily 4-like N-terminal domain-containing protein n=1 Tax=Selenomonas infelix ATCC 43532 TaxID=679201 RepID=G5GRH8_9FIRM|nr:glycosyltransferase [Selenomonas infelix]EHG19544.1 hypothetical protein HMPREF9334_01859 [Selenomonas infelix ATCC 43532]